MRVSEIRVNQIGVNQGLGVYQLVFIRNANKYLLCAVSLKLHNSVTLYKILTLSSKYIVVCYFLRKRSVN